MTNSKPAIEGKTRYIDKKALSEYLGLSRFTIDMWVCQRRIPFIKMGRRVMFDLQDIEKWISQNKIIPIDRDDLPK